MYIQIMYSKCFTESDKDFFFTYLKTPYPPDDQTILNKKAAFIEIKHEISSLNIYSLSSSLLFLGHIIFYHIFGVS